MTDKCIPCQLLSYMFAYKVQVSAFFYPACLDVNYDLGLFIKIIILSLTEYISVNMFS